jgi:hypothetical protein
VEQLFCFSRGVFSKQHVAGIVLLHFRRLDFSQNVLFSQFRVHVIYFVVGKFQEICMVLMASRPPALINHLTMAAKCMLCLERVATWFLPVTGCICDPCVKTVNECKSCVSMLRMADCFLSRGVMARSELIRTQSMTQAELDAERSVWKPSRPTPGRNRSRLGFPLEQLRAWKTKMESVIEHHKYYYFYYYYFCLVPKKSLE